MKNRVKIKFRDEAGYYTFEFSYESQDDLINRIIEEIEKYKSQFISIINHNESK
jgi:hypothetical protein